MSLTSMYIRYSFGKGDRKRDAGLSTPEDVKRYDDILYGKNRKWQGRIQSTSAAATMTSAQQSTHRMAPLTKVFFLERNRTLSSLIRLGLRIIPRSLSFETYLDRNYIPDRKIFPCVFFGLCECGFPHLFKKFSKFF